MVLYMIVFCVKNKEDFLKMSTNTNDKKYFNLIGFILLNLTDINHSTMYIKREK